MKLLYCQACHDIIAPYYANLKPRACICGRHLVWWIDRFAGDLRVCDARGGNNSAFIIGVSNRGLLLPEDAPWTAERVQELIGRAKPNTLFVESRSLVFRVRPGAIRSAQWASASPEAA